MWRHIFVPPLSPQRCTGSPPATSCVLEVGSSSWETGPSGKWGPDKTNTRSQIVTVCLDVCPGELAQVFKQVFTVCIPLAGSYVVAEPWVVFLRSQGGGNQEDLRPGWPILFLCCLKNVSGSFHWVSWSLYNNSNKKITREVTFKFRNLYFPLVFMQSVCLHVCICVGYLRCVNVSVSPVCLVSALLSAHPEVQMLSATPRHEPDGAWLSWQCTALESNILVHLDRTASQWCFFFFFQNTNPSGSVP